MVRELATQFLALAEKQGATVPLMVGHRLMGISLLCTGDIAEGRAHFDRAIALYDPAKHRPLATRFGVDAGVSILSFRSSALWLLGYPEAALADAEHALKDAREIGHAATLMYALHNTSFTLYPSAETTEQQTRKSMKLSRWRTRRAASYWKAIGTLVRGWLLALTGKSLGRSPNDHLRDRCMCGQRDQQCWMPMVFIIFGESLCGAWPI